MDEDDKDMEEEEYDFEYSDEEVEEADVELENAYYAAKGLKAQGDLAGAVEGMQEVLRLEAAGERGEWGFKALKQSVKMLFALGQYEAMLERYVFLLDHYTVTPASSHSAGAAVTQNVAEKGLDSVLDLVSSSSSPSLLRALYDTTLARLEGGEESGREGRAEGGARRRNQRLWFKTNLKLGHLLLSEAMQKEGEESVRLLGRLQRLMKDLLKSCEGPQEGPGEDDSAGGDTIKRGTQLLEVYALQMQLFALQKDSRKLKHLYKLALGITWGVPHPRTLGVLQECGDYNAAIQAFFSSFKCYDEAGDPRRFTLLKYLVLASMLHASTIDPFDSQEAKPYKEEREVVAMRNLILAFQNHDVKAFETILKVLVCLLLYALLPHCPRPLTPPLSSLQTHRQALTRDAFVRAHIDQLLITIRTQVITKLLVPYTRVSLAHIARELNDIPEEDVESLLVSLILDGKVAGYIDQLQRVWVRGKGGEGGKIYVGGVEEDTTRAAAGGIGGGTRQVSWSKGKGRKDYHAMGQLSDALRAVVGRRIGEGRVIEREGGN
ncbi:hypothetical protein NSK_000773 [Nannochloropsis salina CCMP1776]|uniref:PCI domain-containing protein n=1 Tax=Nannochloropsis salina CCMP1776 TaxID=1027361 RepID=A0A4D9DBP3_9STRA|nr:hypothetical protein NSK_000773 [Nannochloropsis salina CCMP1776]|eukprot:TFJ88424.1 hypothetical protein NSK_000773 [Nannochloropsis salina CCMP1776]